MKSSAGEKTEAVSVMLPDPASRLKVTSYEMLSFRYVLPYLHGRRVLDIGCATGLYLKYLEKNAVGYDISALNVQACRKKELQARVVDLNVWQGGEEKADAILLSHILEHLENPAAVLRACNRTLKIGGVLVVGLPIEGGPLGFTRPYFTECGHLYSFSFRNTCFLLKSTGFEPGKRFIHYPLVSRFRLTRLDFFLQSVVPFSLGIRFADGYWIVARKMMDC